MMDRLRRRRDVGVAERGPLSARARVEPGVSSTSRRNADDPYVIPRPAAVVVAGLGEEGTLRATDLALTVRQATLAYAQRMREGHAPADFRPRRHADRQRRHRHSGRDGRAGDRAGRGAGQPAAPVGRLAHGRKPAVDRALPRSRHGGALRPWRSGGETIRRDTSSRRRWSCGPEACRARSIPVIAGPATTSSASNATRRRAQGRRDHRIHARHQARAQRGARQGDADRGSSTTWSSVAASNENRNEKIGRSLFKLLTPIELQRFLSGSSSVLLQLDANTAVYPWELLDTQPDDQRDDVRPWAVRTRMLRKLRTAEFRDRPRDARRDDGALVIGEPQDRPRPISAAAGRPGRGGGRRGDPRRQAAARPRRARRSSTPSSMRRCSDPSCRRSRRLSGRQDRGRRALQRRRVRAARIEVDAGRSRTRVHQLLLSGADRARVDAESRVRSARRRPRFAANVAEQLIQIGVRCVVAAGWAVDDEPAKLFATMLLSGS